MITGKEMFKNTTMHEICGIVDSSVIKINRSMATLRLITDDEWGEEGFELSVIPGHFVL